MKKIIGVLLWSPLLDGVVIFGGGVFWAGVSSVMNVYGSFHDTCNVRLGLQGGLF